MAALLRRFLTRSARRRKQGHKEQLLIFCVCVFTSMLLFLPLFLSPRLNRQSWSECRFAPPRFARARGAVGAVGGIGAGRFFGNEVQLSEAVAVARVSEQVEDARAGGVVLSASKRRGPTGSGSHDVCYRAP